MTTQFIYFDMGNVLVTFDYNIAGRNMAAVTGLPPQQCKEVALTSQLYLDTESGAISDEEFFLQFCQQTGVTCDREAFMHAHADMFGAMPETIRILTQLKAARYRTGLMSNTCRNHFEFVRGRFGAIRGLFDEYVMSYEVGSLKPDKKIYQYAIEQAGVPAESIFFVDDREENIEGAKACGIDAVLYTTADTLLADLQSRGVAINL